MITLFAEPPRASSSSHTFALSIFLHIASLSLLTVQLMRAQREAATFPLHRYSLRVLDFHSKETATRQASEGGLVYSAPPSESKAGTQPLTHNPAASGSASGSPSVTRQTAHLMPAPQTLVQPDINHPIVLPQNVPVPLVVLWSPDKNPTPRIVPPLPAKPTVAAVQPSLDIPIPEEKLADIRVSSTVFVTETPAPVPSTTSPVVVHGPELAKKVPETTSQQPDKPAPARIVSLSDLRAPEGKVAVPMANESSAKITPGATVPGVLQNQSPPGKGNSPVKSSQNVAGKGAGDRPAAKDASPAASSSAAQAGKGDKPLKSEVAGTQKTASKLPSSGAGDKQPGPGLAVAISGAANGRAQGAVFAAAAPSQPNTVRITLPRDGQFGAVVVGSSIEDRYPETAEMWSGRLASTVFLHVGLAKSWILQYALPRLATPGISRLEAPWPFEIVRPTIDLGEYDTDALILHGFVNQDGRFEKLEVVFPPQFPPAQAIQSALNQWEFRAARQDGKFVPVEVLLIIPDQPQ